MRRRNVKNGKIFASQKGDNMLQFLNKMKKDADDQGTGFAMKGVPVEECWESGIDVISSCGTSPQSVPVTLSAVVSAKINTLMQEYPRIEWLAYLIGKDHNVTDIVIPKQEVTSVRVDVDEHGVDIPTIGVIHSHHGMGNGFSGTDHEYINQNHDISLCISHGGIQGQVRVRTSCGKYVIVSADVRQSVEGFDHIGFIYDAKKLISKKVYQYPTNRIGVYDRLGVSAGVVGNDIDNIGEIDTDNFLGIVDLSDTFQGDMKDFIESYDIMDLAGYKELVQEVLRKDGNYDVFLGLYENLLDNNTFSNQEDFFCVPVELMDEMDTHFGKITGHERQSLVNLLVCLTDIIDLKTKAIGEDGEDGYLDGMENLGAEISEVDVPDTKSDNLWNTGEEVFCGNSCGNGQIR